jgi:hypothetical protein
MQVVTNPVRLPAPLPEPGYLIAPLLDALVSLDDVDGRTIAADWSPLPRARNEPEGQATSFGLPYGGPERVVATGFAVEAELGTKRVRRGARRTLRPAGDALFRTVCHMMADGARTILLTRWKTGGRTNLDLVGEFLRELPNSSATDAWQRACLLAREAPLEAAQEPRIKGLDEASGDVLTADHPFFWAGYLLIDTSPTPQVQENGEQPADDVPDNPDAKKKKQPADGDVLPPPAEDMPPPADQTGTG